jgi:acetyl esterase/lipase
MLRFLSVVILGTMLLTACAGSSSNTPPATAEPIPPTESAPVVTEDPVVEPEPEPTQPESAPVVTESVPAVTEYPGPVVSNPLQEARANTTYPTPDGAASVQADPAPPANVCAAEAQVLTDLTISGADNLPISADLYLPSTGDTPASAVILVHMFRGSRADWGDLPQLFVDQCIAVLAFDLRGFGDTGGDIDWSKAKEDLNLIYQDLAGRTEINPQKIALVGASIGANLSLITAANQPPIPAVVMLSPGLDYQGVTSEDALAQYSDRPLLIIASKDDTYAADSAQVLKDAATGETELLLLDGAAHGTAMLTQSPDLGTTIVNWVLSHFQ